ncbi:anti-sigma factor [Microbacterium sp. A94]|uniref:anti-sigma factor n=1 Tax=Microbacterium sp. A94 TaxID=3450717 RepID=UPI003F43FE0C
MNEREFAELAAGHALDALSDADQRRFIDALESHPEWAAIAADDAETANLMADAVSAVEPPASIREALLVQIAKGQTQGPAPGPTLASGPAPATDAEPAHARAPRRWSRGLFALAASVVLIVGLGVGAAVLIPQLMRPASVIALEQIEAAPDAQQASVELDSGLQATAHWAESEGNAVLVAEGLDALDDEQTYQLWFVRGEQPVPAGLFETDGGNATALLDGPMRAGDVIAVTVEPAGGSPTGLPTTDPIIVIPTA